MLLVMALSPQCPYKYHQRAKTVSSMLERGMHIGCHGDCLLLSRACDESIFRRLPLQRWGAPRTRDYEARGRAERRTCSGSRWSPQTCRRTCLADCSPGAPRRLTDIRPGKPVPDPWSGRLQLPLVSSRMPADCQISRRRFESAFAAVFAGLEVESFPDQRSGNLSSPWNITEKRDATPTSTMRHPVNRLSWNRLREGGVAAQSEWGLENGCMQMCIYIYIYMYNRHLGLINPLH